LDRLRPTRSAKIGLPYEPTPRHRTAPECRPPPAQSPVHRSLVRLLAPQIVTVLETMPTSLPGEQKLENFLTHLARNRNLSASTQNQAFNAMLFFCKLSNH